MWFIVFRYVINTAMVHLRFVYLCVRLFLGHIWVFYASNFVLKIWVWHWLSCKNHIFCFWDPKIMKQILWCSLRWLVFNKNVTCTMFSGKNNCYDLILLFMYKFISLDILLLLLWKFYVRLWVVRECYDKYLMIFWVMYLWYVIYVCDMACFLT